MKISNSLLKAIMIGVTVGGAASCSVIEEATPIDTNEPSEVQGKEDHVCDENCAEGCTEEVKNSEEFSWENCPACGMG